MELGKKIKEARLNAGLSQRQLCGDTITRNMLSLIENGTAQPSMDTLRYLARQLEKPVSFFLEEPAASPQQAQLEMIWQTLAQGNAQKAWELLADSTLPSSCQRTLLRCCTALNLAETAIVEQRLPYAQNLLYAIADDCAATPILSQELQRRRILLLHRCGADQADALVRQLPEDSELLLRAAAALEESKPALCIALLDTIRPSETWYALRGKAFFQLGQYHEAAQCYLPIERHSLRQLEACYEKLGDYQKAYYYACRQRDI